MRRGLLRYLARLTLYAGAGPLAVLLAVACRRSLPYIPAHLHEEMRGLAAGADVVFPAILIINVIDDVGNNGPMCSALAAGGRRSESGAFIVGRNLDYPLFTDMLVEFQTLFLVEPDGGLPFASLAWPGYVGVCTGINRAGVTLSQLASMSLDCTLKGVPAALRFRQALEREATVAGVAARVLGAPGTIGNNLLLAGPREAVVLELSATRGAIRHPAQGLITVTNHYQSEAMLPLTGRFPPRPPLSPLSDHHFTADYSRARDARLQELARGRCLGPGQVQEILNDLGVANPGTVGSVVFAPEDLTLWVSRAATPPVSRGPFQKIALWR